MPIRNSLNEILREETISAARRVLLAWRQAALTAPCRSNSASSFFRNGLERLAAGADYRTRR
jgi:hypothetical protein